MLASFRELRRLSLGETASKRPSLAFLRRLQNLEVLSVEAHDKDFDAVGDLPALRELYLSVPRAKTLEPLRGHPRLEVLELTFGGIRDLAPLADIPRLRGLGLYQIRKLDTDDLDALGACATLEAVALGALRNVTRLSAFAGAPRKTLRFLAVERMTGLETLAELGECEALEEVFIVDAKPKDGRLDLVARAPALRHLVVGDHYSKEQTAAADDVFRGETLSIHGPAVRGDRECANVRWRRPVADYLALSSRETTPDGRISSRS